MIRFVDGPAAGQTMLLHRAPRFLRVVRGPGGKWDACDQLDDVPADDETITVYARGPEKPGVLHVNMGRLGGGWYVVAAYRLQPAQPADWQARETSAWQDWCRDQTGAAVPIITEPENPRISP